MKTRIITFDEYQSIYIRSIEEYKDIYGSLYGINYKEKLDCLEVFSNSYGTVKYKGREIFDKVIMLPLAMSYNDVDVAWTCPFNVSDTTVRMRGTYVPPDLRGNGYAKTIIIEALKYWPSWKKCIVTSWYDKKGFYESLGFEAIDNEPRHSFGGPGQSRSDLSDSRTILMEKKL